MHKLPETRPAKFCKLFLLLLDGARSAQSADTFEAFTTYVMAFLAIFRVYHIFKPFSLTQFFGMITRTYLFKKFAKILKK